MSTEPIEGVTETAMLAMTQTSDGSADAWRADYEALVHDLAREVGRNPRGFRTDYGTLHLIADVRGLSRKAATAEVESAFWRSAIAAIVADDEGAKARLLALADQWDTPGNVPLFWPDGAIMLRGLLEAEESA